MNCEKVEHGNLDVTPLLNKNVDVAVLCETAEEARCFVSYMMAHFPERCRGWSMDDIKFDNYRERTCYRPSLNRPEGFTMKYCDLCFYTDNGFTIINFKDLLIVEAEIQEGDKSIEFLLS